MFHDKAKRTQQGNLLGTSTSIFIYSAWYRYNSCNKYFQIQSGGFLDTIDDIDFISRYSIDRVILEGIGPADSLGSGPYIDVR